MTQTTATRPESPPGTGLRLSGIRHAFGATAVLTGVDVEAPAGNLVCLLGPSGCGKTTLLRIAAGLEPIQQGRVQIAGQTVAEAAVGLDLAPEDRGVGLMFQDFALFPHLSILDNITFGAGADTQDRRAWVSAQMERFGLSRLAGAFPNQLSGGQQQRVALLRALAPNPRVLLLDEPFSGLDVALRAQVREDTFHLLRETGITALMVTHDPEEAMAMADRIVILQGGRAEQDGAPVDIYFRPRNRFVAELFGQTNVLQSTARNGLADTPFGPVACGDMADGTPVDVLIRPEGVRPIDALPTRLPPAIAGNGVPHHPPSPPVKGRAHSVQLLGRASVLHLRLDTAPDVELHARVPGVYLPDPDETIQVVCDPLQIFVFPRN